VYSVKQTGTTAIEAVPTVERHLLESVDVVSSTRVRAQKSCVLLSKRTSTAESEIKRLFDVLVPLASIKEGFA
jgi:hypothetical protein